MWFVYIIETKKGKFYTGITVDLERRFNEHLTHKKGAKYFRADAPEKIVYSETKRNRSLASIREWQIKKMTRKEKDELVRSQKTS